ncbi:hypothetical protein BpHYR1_001260 [Brachionus plicatilis]|uniref:Uncharacterized protein n=1 Tax=Brachionus plicatilis TaxID=10195 RepID=A0A3M7RCA1_BRAPC|nr:hypothetical protein BpHYR1_001260 [Brachionus plicatilis]
MYSLRVIAWENFSNLPKYFFSLGSDHKNGNTFEILCFLLNQAMLPEHHRHSLIVFIIYSTLQPIYTS